MGNSDDGMKCCGTKTCLAKSVFKVAQGTNKNGRELVVTLQESDEGCRKANLEMSESEPKKTRQGAVRNWWTSGCQKESVIPERTVCSKVGRRGRARVTLTGSGQRQANAVYDCRLHEEL